MKDKIRKIASAVVTFALICLCVWRLGYIVRPTQTDGAYAQVETFHSLPENSVEVMIYGSSHAQRGLSAMRLYDQYGIGAYNYGWNWQKSNTTHLFLKDSLDKQNPKVAVFETYYFAKPRENSEITPEVYYSRYIHNQAAKTEYLKQNFETDYEKYLYYYVPLWVFHDNWSTLTEASFEPLQTGNAERMNMGYAPLYKTVEVEIPDYHTFGQEELSETAVNEILEMIELCKSRGIEVLFYTAPWEGEYRYSDAIRDLAGFNGCAYLNFFELADEIGLDGETDFADKTHLNNSGSEKLADYIGQYIVDHYDVTDLRKTEGNLWEQAKRMAAGEV